jgi:2-polyprenyl-3-methyl-5-hydroxy-6-metoxy-1,4-benzoquinol methylase
MSAARFTEAYQGSPPWEIGLPQPAVMALVDDGQFSDSVLDVGCGTGENSLYIASRGYPVLGVDGVASAVERAAAKAEARSLPAEFTVFDAFDLTALGRRFDSVLDSAFLHVLSDAASRSAYTDQLAGVVRAGGLVHLLEISELAVGEFPKITTAEIVESFDERWTVVTSRAVSYRIADGEVPAWLVSMQRR